MTAKPRRAKYEVLSGGAGGRWKVTWGGRVIHYADRKIHAIGYAIGHARNLLAQGQLSTLKIKGLNGKIQDERTYGKDPRKTKG